MSVKSRARALPHAGRRVRPTRVRDEHYADLLSGDTKIRVVGYFRRHDGRGITWA